MRPNHRPIILALALFVSNAVVRADAGPTNIDCGHALSFCQDLHFPFDQQEFHGCLWFSFTVPPATEVSLTASSLGGKFKLVGPYDPADPCRDISVSACQGVFPDQIVVNIPSQVSLQPRVYFITVTYANGHGEDVDIDVQRGLACEGGIPTNVDCDTAIPICEDLVFAYDEEWASHYSGCLWFSFTLTGTTHVEIDVSSTGSKIYLHGPSDPEDPCPPCAGEGAIVSHENLLQIDHDLAPGLYYIALTIGNGTQSPIDIDVIEGLACPDPTNIDCDNAIPICEDLVFAYDEEWASHYNSCLWFSFTLSEATLVQMGITNTGGRIYLHPGDPAKPCPPCSGKGSILGANNFLQINQQLPPGLYYVAVQVSGTTQSPIVIDMIEGLACDDPVNIGCDTAIPICEDLVFPYDQEWATQYDGCLWFSFTLTENTHVEVDISSTGSKIYLHGPGDPEDPCPPCGGDGALAIDEHLLQIDHDLVPGIYYIAIAVNGGTQSPIDIDVIEGLVCPDPTNIDCDNAIPICEDLVFAFDEEWADTYDGCLWFSFTLPEDIDVEIDVTTPGSKMALYGPSDPEDPCPPCGGEGSIVSGPNLLHIEEHLAAGLYYITVEIDGNTPSPIDIDVIEGLACDPDSGDGDPTNIDCDSAIPLCEDLTLAYGEEWASPYNGCLWFSFALLEATLVQVDITNTGGGIYVYPGDPEQECPPCTGEGAILGANNILHIDQVLGPGLYYVAVQVNDNTQSPIDIDVIEGLVCPDPTNIDCDNAIPICEDLVFAFDEEWADTYDGCLWFSFTLPEDIDVEIDVTTPGSKMALYGPSDPEDPCPPCGGEGSIVSGPNLLHIEEHLAAGLYYITVEIDGNTPSPIDIDVIEGLACDPDSGGGDPTNIDCDSAILFCADLEFEYDEDWASGYDSCLWFSFLVPELAVVELGITSMGSRIHLYPGDPEEECPPCGVEGILAGQDVLEVDQQLPPGLYYVAIEINDDTQSPIQIDVTTGIECLPCPDCVPAFELAEGEPYILSAWVHVPDLPGNTLTFDTPKIIVQSPPGTFLTSFIPQGPIIDGWQRMEDEFITPPGYSGLQVLFTATSGEVFYDDIRLFPKDGSMKCYVYDPVNLRFVAELDERHYATFYEYDGEGKLARVKKETERGIMTIQESRNNSSKLSGQ